MNTSVVSHSCFLLVFLFTSLLSFGKSHANDVDEDLVAIDQFVDQGTEILLQNFRAMMKVRPNHSGGAFVAKHRTKVSLSGVGINQSQYRQIQSLFDELQDVTGIEGRWLGETHRPYYDAIIVLGSDKEIRRQLKPHLRRSVYLKEREKSACPFWLSVAEDFTIELFAGAIDEGTDIPIEACIYRHVISAYGLMFGYDWISEIDEEWKSHDPNTLMRIDRYLLTALYDPALRIGMLIEDAEPIIRNALRMAIKSDLKRAQ